MATPFAEGAASPDVAGVVLAGGRSRRMGGREKALQPLDGKPMIQHVIDRVAPQVCCLALSVERAASRWERFGLPQLPDPRPGFHGPLGGLLSALRFVQGRAEWLLLVPCDAPFLPLDLARRLLARAGSGDMPGAVARCDGELQPTFSLWHAGLLGALERALQEKRVKSLWQFLHLEPLIGLDWPVPASALAPPPFFNVNDPQSLALALDWLRTAHGTAECSA